MKKSSFVAVLMTPVLLSACTTAATPTATPVEPSVPTNSTLLMPDFTKVSYDIPQELINRSNEDWKKVLPTKTYKILREEATETPGSSEFVDSTEKGTYVTADCGEPVFSSEQKFHSGTGWPSFWAPINPNAVTLVKDPDGMRTEVISTKCKSHLGHVFDDGPQPTGKRFCIDGFGLRFIPDKKK